MLLHLSLLFCLIIYLKNLIKLIICLLYLIFNKDQIINWFNKIIIWFKYLNYIILNYLYYKFNIENILLTILLYYIF